MKGGRVLGIAGHARIGASVQGNHDSQLTTVVDPGEVLDVVDCRIEEPLRLKLPQEKQRIDLGISYPEILMQAWEFAP